MSSAEWSEGFEPSTFEQSWNKKRRERAQRENAELGCFVVHQPRRGEVGG